MTLGKTLWTIILIKLAIIFLVLKLFFFPNYINSNAKKRRQGWLRIQGNSEQIRL